MRALVDASTRPLDASKPWRRWRRRVVVTRGVPVWMIIAAIVLALALLWFLDVFAALGSLIDGPPKAAGAHPDDPGRAAPLRRSAARGLAVRSRGTGRSMGELQLHADAVVLALPTDSIRVPRADLVGVVRTRQQFGRDVADELLELEWRTASGGTDAVACQVDDLDAWLAALGPRSPSS